MDVLMIVFICLIGLLLILANIYLLAYYCHPDDRGFGSAIVCKIVVILGLSLAWAQVLMLPLDVSNMTGFGGGLNMHIFWLVVYISTAAFVLIIIPAFIVWYEADPDWTAWEKIKYSFCYLFVIIGIVAILLGVLYAFIGTAYIPVVKENCPILNIEKSNTVLTSVNLSKCITTQGEFAIKVSFPIYLIGFMSFISWFIFVIFGGIGLAAIPLDLFYDFHTRPKTLKPRALENLKQKIMDESQSLKELANEVAAMENQGAKKKNIFSKDRRIYNEKLNKLRAGVHVIDKQYQVIAIQDDIKKQTKWVVFLWLGLFLGIFCLLITLTWIAQILTQFVIIPHGKPIHPLLNDLFIFFEQNNVAFLAFGFFALFALYLLFATLKGNIKFGLRIFCWTLHPMKKNETYMNSFLFNILLVLLASVSITQFCSAAFAEYTAMADVSLIFNVQIRYLVFFVYFYKYHVFEYTLLLVFLISTIYLLCRPSDINSVEKIVKYLLNINIF